MLLTEKPSVPAERHGRKTGRKTNTVRQLRENSSANCATFSLSVTLVLLIRVPHKHLLSSTTLLLTTVKSKMSFHSSYKRKLM